MQRKESHKNPDDPVPGPSMVRSTTAHSSTDISKSHNSGKQAGGDNQLNLISSTGTIVAVEPAANEPEILTRSK